MITADRRNQEEQTEEEMGRSSEKDLQLYGLNVKYAQNHDGKKGCQVHIDKWMTMMMTFRLSQNCEERPSTAAFSPRFSFLM